MAELPVPTIGEKLRAARERWQLSLRQVEGKSLDLARKWGNPAYGISFSWLDRVERQGGSLSATKLIVLAAIYGLSPQDLLALCPPSEGPAPPLDRASGPGRTMLVPGGPLQEQAEFWLPDSLVENTPPERTDLLAPLAPGALPRQYRRGILGTRDRTLEPMIRAGSILLINTQKRAIAARKQWLHEFDRPIYFLLSREGYHSGFCELDENDQWLSLVPHPLSHESIRRWRYRKEIEVIGTVDGVLLRRNG